MTRTEPGRRRTTVVLRAGRPECHPILSNGGLTGRGPTAGRTGDYVVAAEERTPPRNPLRLDERHGSRDRGADAPPGPPGGAAEAAPAQARQPGARTGPGGACRGGQRRG